MVETQVMLLHTWCVTACLQATLCFCASFSRLIILFTIRFVPGRQGDRSVFCVLYAYVLVAPTMNTALRHGTARTQQQTASVVNVSCLRGRASESNLLP